MTAIAPIAQTESEKLLDQLAGEIAMEHEAPDFDDITLMLAPVRERMLDLEHVLAAAELWYRAWDLAGQLIAPEVARAFSKAEKKLALVLLELLAKSRPPEAQA